MVPGTSSVGAAVGDGARSKGPSPTIDTTGLVWTGSVGGSSTPPISSTSHGTATSRPTLVRTLTSPSGFSPTRTKRAWRGVRTMPCSSTSARLGRTRRSCADAWKRIAPTNETRAAPAEPFATVAVSAASPSESKKGVPPFGSTRTETRVVLPEVSHRPRSVARGSASPSEGPSGAICREGHAPRDEQRVEGNERVEIAGQRMTVVHAISSVPFVRRMGGRARDVCPCRAAIAPPPVAAHP